MPVVSTARPSGSSEAPHLLLTAHRVCELHGVYRPAAAAMAPAAGPDSTMYAGRVAAARSPAIPPCDCMTSSLPVTPMSASLVRSEPR